MPEQILPYCLKFAKNATICTAEPEDEPVQNPVIFPFMLTSFDQLRNQPNCIVSLKCLALIDNFYYKWLTTNDFGGVFLSRNNFDTYTWFELMLWPDGSINLKSQAGRAGYLDGNTIESTVYTSPATNDIYIGTWWLPVGMSPTEGGNSSWALFNLGVGNFFITGVFLDGDTTSGEVFLSPGTNIYDYSGTHCEILVDQKKSVSR